MALAALRGVRAVRHRVRPFDASPLLSRLIADCCTLSIQELAAGMSFRLSGQTEQGVPFKLTCTLHTETAPPLTAVEAAVVELLCEGRTRAQIAHLRGVSVNTVKSQIRQIFRKLDVDSRVELVRRWCP